MHRLQAACIAYVCHLVDVLQQQKYVWPHIIVKVVHDWVVCAYMHKQA